MTTEYIHTVDIEGAGVEITVQIPTVEERRFRFEVGDTCRVIITNFSDARHPFHYTVVKFLPQNDPSLISLGFKFQPLANQENVHYVESVEEAVRIAAEIIAGKL